MMPDNRQRPTTEAAAAEVSAPAPAAVSPAVSDLPSAVTAKPADEFDPLGWEVPLICKDCGKGFKVPYRHFQAGVVFHCPHCHGSFVPKVGMYRSVREAFETFYSRRKREHEEFARSGRDETSFRGKQERDLAQFQQLLDEIARAMRPAGKMVKPGWLAAMFS
jgi:hypothetical protein